MAVCLLTLGQGVIQRIGPGETLIDQRRPKASGQSSNPGG